MASAFPVGEALVAEEHPRDESTTSIAATRRAAAVFMPEGRPRWDRISSGGPGIQTSRRRPRSLPGLSPFLGYPEQHDDHALPSPLLARGERRLAPRGARRSVRAPLRRHHEGRAEGARHRRAQPHGQDTHPDGRRPRRDRVGRDLPVPGGPVLARQARAVARRCGTRRVPSLVLLLAVRDRAGRFGQERRARSSSRARSAGARTRA